MKTLRKEELLPRISPYWANVVRVFINGTDTEITSGSHHLVSETIYPLEEITPLFPVFADRTSHFLFSIARNLAKLKCCL